MPNKTSWFRALSNTRLGRASLGKPSTPAGWAEALGAVDVRAALDEWEALVSVAQADVINRIARRPRRMSNQRADRKMVTAFIAGLIL